MASVRFSPIGCWPPWRPHRALAPMNKDAQCRRKVERSESNWRNAGSRCFVAPGEEYLEPTELIGGTRLKSLAARLLVSLTRQVMTGFAKALGGFAGRENRDCRKSLRNDTAAVCASPVSARGTIARRDSAKMESMGSWCRDATRGFLGFFIGRAGGAQSTSSRRREDGCGSRTALGEDVAGLSLGGPPGAVFTGAVSVTLRCADLKAAGSATSFQVSWGFAVQNSLLRHRRRLVESYRGSVG